MTVSDVHAVSHRSVWVYDLFANMQCLKEPAHFPHQKWKPKTFASVAHSIQAMMCNIFSNAPRIDIVVDCYRMMKDADDVTEGMRSKEYEYATCFKKCLLTGKSS